MKKVLLIATCILLLVCLCACSKNSYKTMNEVLERDYSSIEIEIVSEKGSDKLTSTVKVSTDSEGVSTVNYQIEQFSKISATTVPSDYITKSTGTVVVKNGEIISQTGDKISGVDFVAATSVQYDFRKEYFANATFADGVFMADVLAPRQFTGNSTLDCEDMKVKFAYGDAEKVLHISYVDENGVAISLNYILK